MLLTNLPSSRPCSVPGCNHSSRRYSPVCSIHRKRQDRWGHPSQPSVTALHLKPHLQTVERRITKNPDAPVWAALHQRWGVVVDHARSILAAYESGQPTVRDDVQAAQQVVALEGAADGVVRVSLAMFLMWSLEPRRFKDHRAFLHCWTRRVRHLNPATYGTYWDDRRKKVRKVSKDLTPRATAVLAQWLQDSLGTAGVLFVQQEERNRIPPEVRARQQLTELMEELQ